MSDGLRIGLIAYTKEDLDRGYTVEKFGSGTESRPISLDALMLYELRLVRQEMRETRELLDYWANEIQGKK